MGAVWFTSDLHLGHSMVAGLRGFRAPDGEPDPGAHDAAVTANWTRLVRPGDQVWVLGDLAVASSAARVREVLDLIGPLPGEKHLIAGNHDPVHPGNRDSHKWFARYMTVFASVQAFARRKVSVPRPDGTSIRIDVMLSHFPYVADRGFEARYPEYRLPDTGNWLIHGHTHSAEKRSEPRGIHIGLDAWDLCPVPLGAVEALIRESAGRDGGDG